jgi:hypothetical protein
MNEEGLANWGGGDVVPKKNFYYTFFKDTSFAKVNMEIQA